jgi:hypothetical protein
LLVGLCIESNTVSRLGDIHSNLLKLVVFHGELDLSFTL